MYQSLVTSMRGQGRKDGEEGLGGGRGGRENCEGGKKEKFAWAIYRKWYLKYSSGF